MSEGDDRIAAFFRGAPDSEGRTLDEILAWSDELLEEGHDYIQWLFPTSRRSDFNPSAPVLTPETIREFHRDEALRRQLERAFARILQFYGFELASGVVRRGPSWRARSAGWLAPGDHNLLRITRILDSLATLGLLDHAQAFLAVLLELEAEPAGRAIGGRTFRFWRDALRG